MGSVQSDRKYVCGFLFDMSLKEFVLQREQREDFMNGKWNGIGGKIERSTLGSDPPMTGEFTDYRGIKVPTRQIEELPQQAMEREFLEETGTVIKAPRWHKFHKKHFKHNGVTIYYLAAFGDEIKKFRSEEDIKNSVQVHSWIDLHWAGGKEYVYDIPYLLSIIKTEHANGTFYCLGVS